MVSAIRSNLPIPQHDQQREAIMSRIASIVVQSLRHRGTQVLLFVSTYLLLASHLPMQGHQALYTISVFIKDLLLLILPVTVGLFIAHTVSSFQQKAPLFIVSIIFFEALSNLSSVWYSFLCGHAAVGALPPISLAQVNADFSVLWQLPLKRAAWWSADKGVMAGLAIGCLGAVFRNDRLLHAICRGKERSEWILTHLFSRLIPLFVLGFVARMYQTHLLDQVFAHYTLLIVWLVGCLAAYITLLFFAGNGWSTVRSLRAMKNLTPAGAIAFSSGCSLSTMPWTIEGTGKNLRTPSFASAVIPATTNIQQIGDCITNTFLCFLIYTQFFGASPSFSIWLPFSIVFVLARFATAAVIGGAIFIMLPIYEAYLSFTPEMIALMVAFNVILDPLVTSTNVIANGALCQIFEKAWSFVLRSRPSAAEPS